MRSPGIIDFFRSRHPLIRGAVSTFVLIATSLFAQDPSKDPDSFDIEPPLLIPNRDEQNVAKPDSAAGHDVDLAKLEKEFARAKRNSAGLDRLLKIGALSKLEVEQRRLRVIHLEFDLANARLLAAKEQMLAKDKELRSGEIAKTEVASTENDLARAIEAAHAAITKRKQAEIDAAEANVHRQEKLLALGSARKSDVERALQKLAALKSQRTN